jgi:hypothetical protein
MKENVFVFAVQIGSRSSVYSPESRVRKTGSFIYEDFMPTDGTDVKVRQHCFICNMFQGTFFSPSVSFLAFYVV